VSLVVQGQVDQLWVNKARPRGKPIDLAEPIDETVLTLKVGVNLCGDSKGAPATNLHPDPARRTPASACRPGGVSYNAR